jgi:hypothetical protein
MQGRRFNNSLTATAYLVGMKKVLSCQFECYLRVSLFPDVTRDLGKSDQRVVVVADGVDDGIGPETRPVLTQPPAFDA